MCFRWLNLKFVYMYMYFLEFGVFKLGLNYRFWWKSSLDEVRGANKLIRVATLPVKAKIQWK